MDSETKRLYKRVGKSLKRARDAKGYSQNHIAKVIGLNRTSVSNFEHGRQKILLDTLWKIAGILEVPVANLVPEYENLHTSVEKSLPKNTPRDIKTWIVSEVVSKDE